MRNPLLLPTNQIYKQLNCKEYLRISLEKAEKELGGWRVKHCVTVTRRRGLAELGSVKWCVRSPLHQSGDCAQSQNPEVLGI
nr:hypothetical protein CFP56_78604 [Quercus suber]